MAKCPVHVTSLLPPPRITAERRAAERDMLHRAAGIGNPTDQTEQTEQTEQTDFDAADRADQEDGFWPPEESKDEDYGALGQWLEVFCVTVAPGCTVAPEFACVSDRWGHT